MIWAGALADLNDIELATFGQPVTVIVGTEETVLTGIFTAALVGGQDPTRSPFGRPDPRVAVSATEIVATGASAGDRVTVEGNAYVIVDLVPDGGGMTDVILRPI
jgi:hypothetical protein